MWLVVGLAIRARSTSATATHRLPGRRRAGPQACLAGVVEQARRRRRVRGDHDRTWTRACARPEADGVHEPLGLRGATHGAFHKLDVDHILVVHDEIDLPFGTVRLKNGGGHGGHNGLRSIIEQLGSDKFARVRMGVGRDPNAQAGAKQANAAAGWVLSDFPRPRRPS